ncbi:EamA family transporter [Candidatus Woesearchaeota archaeon]|nr:EamA family transporter [Candidatus Woesearchaeota archaeon]
MATKRWAIGLVLICTLFTSSAQVFFKFGAEILEFDILKIITNYYLIGGLMLYALGAVLLITALKGGELSVLYPIISTSYIWVALLSSYFFGDSLNMFKWAGIFLIVFGVSFVGFGSRDGSMTYTEAI